MPNKKTIVIADSNHSACDKYRSIIRNIFPEYNYEILSDAVEAKQRLGYNGYNLAIIDINLNDRDVTGLHIAKDCILSGKPVIIYTATGIMNRLYLYLESRKFEKNVSYLIKPIDERLLVSTIKEMITKEVNPTTINQVLVKELTKRSVFDIFS